MLRNRGAVGGIVFRSRRAYFSTHAPRNCPKKSECREVSSFEYLNAPSAGWNPALGVFRYSKLPPETVLKK
ncbi:hypothetical protein PET01_14200 [Pediococcus ethanolidurans]|nr:hypothetical protein PET01_14200 [Pediococcus ethanolidurans]